MTDKIKDTITLTAKTAISAKAFIQDIADEGCYEAPGEYPEPGEYGQAPCKSCQARQILNGWTQVEQ